VKFSTAVFLFLLACTERPPVYVGLKAKTLNMSGAALDVQLPSELFDEIMDVYQPPVFDQTANDRENETKARLEIPTDFFSFHVFLTERTKGVLGASNFDLVYGKGGGELDLKDFVRTDKGTFYLGVKPMLPANHKKEILKVYFLSNSQKWESDEESFGAGCNVYLDIGDFFNSAMQKTGFVVNVNKQRHVGLLSGTLFFAISIEGRLYLSQLTIKDSRYRKLQCN
jgi:hypothetical protein